MKKATLLIILILILGLFLWIKKPVNNSENSPSSSSPSPTLVPAKSEQIIDFEKNGISFRAAWIKTSDFKNLFLYPNLKEKLSAQELFGQKKCRSLVSAGFYTPKEEPIGFFITEGEKIGERVESRLFDGFFSVDKSGKAQINFQTPEKNMRLALQSGPVLIKNNQTLRLQIKDDKSSRRVVLALDRTGEAFFIIIFNKDSVFEGPLLADLPKVVQGFEAKTGIDFPEALNLDGGSASAFYTNFLSLPEFSLIGSYFCINS